VLAASATVGRPLRRELTRFSGRTLQLVHAPADSVPAAATVKTPSVAHAAAAIKSPAKARPGRAVTLPAAMEVGVLVSDEDNAIAAIHHAIREAKPRATLLFTQPGRKLAAEVRLLQQCGLPQALPLSARFGVPFESTTRQAGKEDAAAEGGEGCGGPLYVASPSTARGLDMPEIDLVIIWGLPLTADQLLHLAGRTARQGAPGTAVVVSTRAEAARLQSVSTQLGVDLVARQTTLQQRNERWAETWAVHQKVVQAERKYG